MNYTTTEINGKTVDLRFGMSTYLELVESADSTKSTFTAELIYHAHLNYCYSRKTKPVIEFYEVLDHVDMVNISKPDDPKVIEVLRILELWTNILPKPDEKEDTKKKNRKTK